MSTVKYLLCGGQGTVQASEGVGEILNISMQYPQPRSSPSRAVPPPRRAVSAASQYHPPPPPRWAFQIKHSDHPVKGAPMWSKDGGCCLPCSHFDSLKEL
jgi:hypothetical protein